MIRRLWDRIKKFFIDEEFNEKMSRIENVVQEEKVDSR